jgi:pimeloyl-ACP methyl ester carboxylesterase
MTAMDLPGHGRSPDWDRSVPLQDQATAMARAALPEGAHVVGHSFGAVVALCLALEGASVASLTLIEPVLMAAAREAAAPAHAENRAAFALLQEAFAGRPEEATRRFVATWGDGRPWEALPPVARAYRVERMGLVLAQTPALDEDPAGLLAPGRPEALDLPVLLVEGERSPPVVAAIQARLAERLPRARRIVVAGAGHMAPLTHPRPVAEAIHTHIGA